MICCKLGLRVLPYQSLTLCFCCPIMSVCSSIYSGDFVPHLGMTTYKDLPFSQFPQNGLLCLKFMPLFLSNSHLLNPTRQLPLTSLLSSEKWQNINFSHLEMPQLARNYTCSEIHNGTFSRNMISG